MYPFRFAPKKKKWRTGKRLNGESGDQTIIEKI